MDVLSFYIYLTDYFMKSHSPRQSSDDELNEEINDKLNQLWTGMNSKRKQLLRNLTSGSRRTDQSEIMHSTQHNNLPSADNQVLKLREKLAQEVSNSKHKDLEIENLKKTILQLTNDKKILINQLHQVYGQENSSAILNESSIEIDKSTANFSHKKTKKNVQKFATISEQPEQVEPEKKHSNDELEKMNKSRLIELLRSTAEYREFIFYYDSHELSYLRRLQEQHRKNCDKTLSAQEKKYWAPVEILDKFAKLNQREKYGLSEPQRQHIISILKGYYQKNEQEKVRKIQQDYENRLKKLKRLTQNSIPYDLIQVCKAKQRQLSSNGKKRPRTNTFK